MAAFGCRSTMWMRRRRENFTSSFKSSFSSTFGSTSAGPEYYRQLPTQHDIHGGDATVDDCCKHHSIRQFGNRRIDDSWRNRIIKGAPLFGVGCERKHHHLRKGAPS